MMWGDCPFKFGDWVKTPDGIGIVTNNDSAISCVWVALKDWEEAETDPGEWYGYDQVQICTLKECE